MGEAGRHERRPPQRDGSKPSERNPKCATIAYTTSPRGLHRVGEILVSTGFPSTHTRGFASPAEPNVAVCLLPGTEIAFAENARRDEFLIFSRSIKEKVARFRQVHLDLPYSHHDALEFASGRIVLLTELSPGQRATVLQLPSSGVRAETSEEQGEQGQAATANGRG